MLKHCSHALALRESGETILRKSLGVAVQGWWGQ